ncbi:MAG: DEAD/DEAH box helicase, partial [Dysgonamonadaceae bacterium]|nr:DEAD/DEAH box helicase [Dysgonamonadaceae bacterium]
SYQKKPANMTTKQWQRALRRQFAETHPFGVEKRDDSKSPYGDYTVNNPLTGNSYKVSFRGYNSPMNFCSCLDFKTNQLGTCKHLEIVKYLLLRDNYISDINRDFTPDYTSVFLSYNNGREVKIRLGSSVSLDFDILVKKYFDQNDTLRPEMIDDFDDFLLQACELDETFRCYDDAMEYIIDYREHSFRQKLADAYRSDEDFTGLINAKLYPYQKEGVLFAFKAGRSLNADEMGLGKTVQAIAAAQMFRKERGIEKTLIICPTSLKYQWQSEIKRFTGEDAFVIEGYPFVRRQQYAREEFFKIVSYHTLINDIEAVIEQNFDLIVLDEAQRIKNWKTKLAQAVKKIQTPYCMVLTGTPLENRIEELYSVVQFVNPFVLGPYWHFQDYYQVKDYNGKVIGYRHLDEISKLLADTIKRRRKSDVLLQLPDRVDKNLFVPMTEQQLSLHTEYQNAVAQLVNKWKRMGFLTEKDRQRLLNCMNMMRMSCDSTFLFDQKTRFDTKIDELMSILNEYFDGNNEKAVVFSQWERMTRIIAGQLDAAGIEYQLLHGGIPSKDRKALFDNFNNSPSCRVFLSTDAGSTGLNLQAASLIVNMDIPWNSAVLEQRVARIHRLGQKNSVQVINFVSKDTIEERMLSVLKFKSSLAEGILDNGEAAIFLEDSKFNAFMKNVEMMTSDADIASPVSVSDAEGDEENRQLAPVAPTADKIEESGALLIGDDDCNPVDAHPSDDEKSDAEKTADEQPAIDASVLMAQGFSFLNSLAQTLSNPDGAAKLAHSLVEKDETTGQTHLKIPVESEEAVGNVLKFIGNLLKLKQ